MRQKHHIRGLAGNSGQGDKLFHASGNLAGKIFGNKFRGGAQILRLLAKKPMERMTPSSSSWLVCASSPGPGQRANRSGVTMFTRASVHWADKTTATSNSHGFACKSRGGWRVGIAFGKNFSALSRQALLADNFLFMA